MVEGSFCPIEPMRSDEQELSHFTRIMIFSILTLFHVEFPISTNGSSLEVFEQFLRSKPKNHYWHLPSSSPKSNHLLSALNFRLFVCVYGSLSLLLSRSLLTELHSSNFHSASISFIFLIEDRMIFQKLDMLFTCKSYQSLHLP